MSKIIVEKLQRSGGPEMSLPTATGVANSILVNDGSGNLEFSTLGSILPAAAEANTYLTNDGSGNLSFSTVGRALDESKKIVGLYMTSTSWNSSNPLTAWDFDSGPIDTVLYKPFETGTNTQSNTMTFNMLMGDGRPAGTSDRMFVANGSEDKYREVRYAWGNRVGQFQTINHQSQDTSGESGVTFSVLPIRNTSGAPETVSLNAYFSNHFAVYGGMGIGLYTPNATTYSGATGGTWSQLLTDSTTGFVENSLSFTIPANTTVLLVAANTHQYYTTALFYDMHMYYNLQNCFSPTNGVYCDLRMLEALRVARVGINNTTIDPSDIYNFCAESFGDR
jgi:hypothetical protein